jgi:hypothetical protein
MHNRIAKEKFRGKECGNDIRFLLLQLKRRIEMENSFPDCSKKY